MGIPKWLVAAALVFLILGRGRTQTPDGAPQPLGRMVDVGGYRVHLYCIGSGSPTVVITGAGYSFDWGLVQPEVAKFTRVCAYDHSGVAWSDPGPMDKCSLRVGEIHSALKNANITGPYVLVGHSLGALVSRLYASKYEGEVAGMVIVDHATGPVATRIIGAPGAPPGPPRLLPPPATKPDPNAGFEKLSAHDYQLHVWANSQPGFSQVMKRNVEMLTECGAEVEAATQNQASPLGDKPFIALSQPGARQQHTQLLALSLNSKQVVAANSGHYVMIDRPDVVIGAIREVVQAAQDHTKLKK
jgi:pimeloyl-ACP methyl ester carboxylesterase